MTPGRRIVLALGCALAFAIVGFRVAARLPLRSPDAKGESRQDAPVLLRITGEVAHPQAFPAEEFAKLPRQTMRAGNHAGVEAQYEGVALADLLAKAGVPGDKQLKGQAMALYLVVEAADAYRAVFSLAELDRSFTDRVILLADRRDGQPLSAHEGPLQVIVPGEKKHARWVAPGDPAQGRPRLNFSEGVPRAPLENASETPAPQTFTRCARQSIRASRTKTRRPPAGGNRPRVFRRT